MSAKTRGRGKSRSADAGGGVRNVSMSLVDLTQKSNQQLVRARRQRVIVISVFAAILVLGVITLLVDQHNGFAWLSIGFVLLGIINVAISGGGLFRVLEEQRMRDSEKRAKELSHRRDDEGLGDREPWQFHED